MKTTAELAIGIDFGGTKMLGVLVDAEGNIVSESRVPTPYNGEELLDAIARMVGLLNKPGDDVNVLGVGVGAAGLVDQLGVLRFGPNVGGIVGLDVLGGLTRRLTGHRVCVSNDATCATWAEHLLGVARGIDEMTLVTLGTGIGGGSVIGGGLVLGRRGFAGEPGHMTVDARGVACICGKIGCWEAYASGRALARMGREAVTAGSAPLVLELAGAVDDIRGEHVTRAARAGDSGALGVLEDFAWWLAVGVSNLVAIEDPELVVLGGGLSEEADLFIEKAQSFLDEITYGGHERPRVPLVVGTMGERSGAIGAAMLVHRGEMATT